MKSLPLLLLSLMLTSCVNLNIDSKDCDHSRLCEALKKADNPKFPSCSFSVRPMTREGKPLEGDLTNPSTASTATPEDIAKNYLQSIDGIWVGEKCIN